MIILDASVLIGHLDRGDAHHAGARALLRAHADHLFGVSVITIAEVLVDPVRAGSDRAARQALDRLGVLQVPVGDGAAGRLAGLRAATGLKMPDCCVIAAAQEGDGLIATFDERLAKQARALGLEALTSA